MAYYNGGSSTSHAFARGDCLTTALDSVCCVMDTTHGTPTHKKEIRNSRDKHKNVKEENGEKRQQHHTHGVCTQKKVDDAQGRDEIE
jgi:hypothetical protein